MRMKVQGRLMQPYFIEIHQVFAKINKDGYFSNRAVLVEGIGLNMEVLDLTDRGTD